MTAPLSLSLDRLLALTRAECKCGHSVQGHMGGQCLAWRRGCTCQLNWVAAVAPLIAAWTLADEQLAEAVKDMCWRAVQYGETEDGDTYAYLVTKGSMHRLIGAAQAAGIPAAFRAALVLGHDHEGDK